ncbi:MAG: hypothetical protein DRM99_05795 [Thermoplasmata archaeon]|nr:MAG: hypothetical protein DRM99_05795 [Thermoplasmata archaeon]
MTEDILAQLGLGGVKSLLDEIEVATANELMYLLVLILVISIGMLIIWYLYKKLARRDMFKLNLRGEDGEEISIGKELWCTATYLFKYIILFPLFVILMFFVISLAFMFMSSGLDLSSVFFFSIAIICVVRLLAYIKEDTAQEIAKMIPFALVLSLLLNPTLSQGYSFPSLEELELASSGIWQYFIFVFVFEIGLRVIYRITRVFKKSKK